MTFFVNSPRVTILNIFINFSHLHIQEIRNASCKISEREGMIWVRSRLDYFGSLD